ncbi:TPA: hypothetical protein ACH3X3_000678 [Trebouxia sp. C0006]
MDPGQGTRAGAACSCVCIFTNVLWDCCCKNSNMSNGQVIRAAQMFVKHGAGASKGVNLKAEMAMGLTLGLGVGLTWKVYHWNEKRKQAEYYTTLARLEKQKE